ncbi:hypothetical protein RhiTH_003922 [Rhizoctonia solani]
MSGLKAPVYITENTPQTIVPVTSHAGDEVSGPPQRQAAQDIDHKAIQDTPQSALLDIEHQPVDDDPRLWSKNRKITIVAIIAFATLAPTFSVNLYNPAFAQIKKELNATNGQIALSLALFILVQGNAPIIWSAVSEIKGRKIVYIVSMVLFCIGSAICGAAKDMKVLIGMRIVQAAGSSSVLNLGAGTLIIFAGVSLGTFVFLPDTWRRERSTSYQAAKQRALKERAKPSQAGTPTRSRAPSPTRSGTVTPIIGANTPTGLTQGYEDKKQAQEQVANAATTVVKSEKHGVQDEDIKLSITDVNPISPIWHILKERSNLCILFASGNLSGSILGGRWSDRVLGQLKAKNGGESVPEMRLQSTKPALIFLPFFVIAYAWMCEKHVNIAGPVVVLFFSGFCAIWIYSSTLAYIVDSNPGRASSAIATNSSFRGISGLIAAEISIPLKNALGDGGLYTLWAGLLVICEVLIILLIWRGGKWRAARQQGLPV